MVTKVLKSGPDRTVQPEKPWTSHHHGSLRLKNWPMPKKQETVGTAVQPHGYGNRDQTASHDSLWIWTLKKKKKHTETQLQGWENVWSLFQSLCFTLKKCKRRTPPAFDLCTTIPTGLRSVHRSPPAFDLCTTISTGLRSVHRSPPAFDLCTTISTGLRSVHRSPPAFDLCTDLHRRFRFPSLSSLFSDVVNLWIIGSVCEMITVK